MLKYVFMVITSEHIKSKIIKADVIVVGAGFFGLTIAERAARSLDKKVLVLDKRNHIGGNAHSYFDEKLGIEIHKYGSHLFHTNNDKVWDYINLFTKFNNYQHKVVALANNHYFDLPINLSTLSSVFGSKLTPSSARKMLESFKVFEEENNLEEKAINQVGEVLFQMFIKGYTEKQWGMSTKLLPKATINRLPVRTNFDSRYFTDKYQGLPLEGYGKLFENMVNHQNIQIELNTDYFEIEDFISSGQLVIYTGPIDRYFNYKHGVLGWRTVDFEFETLEVDDYQGNSVINYCDMDIPYTRIHEFFHLHPERTKLDGFTVIAKEFSRIATESDDPYYPVNSILDRDKLLKYRSEVSKGNVLFGGRLGTYQYLDMHMAIASALSLYETKVVDWFTNG